MLVTFTSSKFDPVVKINWAHYRHVVLRQTLLTVIFVHHLEASLSFFSGHAQSHRVKDTI